jgi:hypothetical protein
MTKNSQYPAAWAVYFNTVGILVAFPDLSETHSNIVACQVSLKANRNP